MPLILPDDHPAYPILKKEGYDLAIGGENPLRIAVLNLMPDKEATELNLSRMLGASGHCIDISWLTTETYRPRNADPGHLRKIYKTFTKIRERHFDGMIITGAPVEHLEFEQVAYWEELTGILDWAPGNVRATLSICWAAQAVLYHHYGIGKVPMGRKLSGVYRHRSIMEGHPLLEGIEGEFTVPQSRYTGIPGEEVMRFPDLKVLADSTEGGVHLVEAPSVRCICMTGHPEYNAYTLADEYERDLKKGLAIMLPENYFKADDPSRDPIFSWSETGRRFYSNWLDHFVSSSIKK